jgi:hypothetical protein
LLGKDSLLPKLRGSQKVRLGRQNHNCCSYWASSIFIWAGFPFFGVSPNTWSSHFLWGQPWLLWNLSQ